MSVSENVKAPEYERTDSQTAGMEFNDAGVTLNRGFHTAEKFGNENISAEVTEDFSTSVSTDGTIKSSMDVGSEIKTENLEVGAKASASSISTENGQENSVGMEASAGMKIADGMKMKNSVKMEHTGKSSETEEAYTEEETESIAFQSRIEVDSEKATLGKKVAASIYNAGMKVAETGVNSMLSSSSKTEILKESGKEEDGKIENEEQESVEEEEQKETEESEASVEEAEQTEDYYYGMGY